MEKTLSSCKLESHPGKKLITHLEKVAELSAQTVEEKDINVEKNYSKYRLVDIAYIIGFTHDIGKATSDFQEYLTEKDEEKKKRLRNKEETRHSLLSAFFTYIFVKDYLGKEELLEDNYYQFLPLISFMAVKLHHDNPDNFFDEILPIKNKEELLVKQLASIDKNELNQILSACPYPHPDFNSIKDNMKEIIKSEICKKEKNLLRALFKRNDTTFYLLFQFLYSVLLTSDKWDAIGFEERMERAAIDSDLVDSYIAKKFNQVEVNRMDSIRNNIYKNVTDRIDSIDLSGHIYSLSVPTGTGKTLTSFSFALKLREKIIREKKYIPRIIYVLPFLSIIDQNFKVFEEVFQMAHGKKPSNKLLLKHHHLAEIAYNSEDFREDEFSTSESQFLIEGWESEVIVTTFMQFFHSLISNKNRMIRKFQNMANSIFILDEVQIIPYKYWQLVRKLLLSFSELFNSYFIFVTATQPLIFDNAEKEELVQSKKDYLDDFDRIQFVNETDKILTIDEFKKILNKDIFRYPDDSFLIVLNTIDASIKIYEFLIELREENKNLSDANLFYLSTNIIPKHRLERIDCIRKTKDKRKIIVSTQIVEAGVDIDVDRVYRDFAPFDSLNQVAGRCNRNYDESKKGIVTVFILKDEHKEYYKYIYGKSDLSISKTKDILKNHSSLTEKEFLKLGTEYFERIERAKSDDEAIRLMGEIASLKFSEFSSHFKLIEADYPTHDIFIEIDNKAASIWQKFMDIRDIDNRWDRKMAFLEIKKDFYEYIISVPRKIVRENEFENTGMVHISSLQIPNVYNEETGYIRKEGWGYLF